MARYYLDSSALVKRYHPEHGSFDVDSLFAIAGNQFFSSRLALVEVRSALARLVREHVLAVEEYRKLIARLDADVATGVLAVAAVSTQRLEDASVILGSHGLADNIRTLDAIHLSTAAALHGRAAIAGFVAADQRLLASAAAGCGLPVLDVA
ncbi:MAG TPA: type II toxin-antitoxin system VapC family toxin [Lacipirellulaceae bacterium]|jgi:predicted nucleic acid-binding protein